MRSLDNAIAEQMWAADNRPCRWSDLSSDEQAEWEKMARAARLFLVKWIGANLDAKKLIREGDVAAGISGIVQSLALAALREAA